MCEKKKSYMALQKRTKGQLSKKNNGYFQLNVAKYFMFIIGIQIH